MSDPTTNSARRIALGWLPALSYMALIWLLSSGPVSLPIESLPFKDKAAHLLEYGTLAILNVHAIRRTWLRLGLLRMLSSAVLLTFAWGYLDELHQAFVPGRNSDAMDLLADTIGACVGAVCFGIFLRLRRD